MEIIEEQFHNIIEATADVIMIVDHDQIIQYVNPSIKKIYDDEVTNIIGQPLLLEYRLEPVSYTHLTLPTIYSV